jgi:hypothetical protein
MTTGHLTNLAALEQISDMHRAAERSHLQAAARPPRARGRREIEVRTRRNWLGLRRSPKLA